jgi:hypothetical protein
MHHIPTPLHIVEWSRTLALTGLAPLRKLS